MGVIAFDAKQFRRGKIIIVEKEGKRVEKYTGFNSQLGIGTVIPNPDSFTKKYIEKSMELGESFGMKDGLPFYSSTHLKQTLGLQKTISFTDQIVIELQDELKTIHCSYVILPPKKNPTITVGGFKSPMRKIATNRFIDNLGPMFSYLTTHNFLHSINFDVSGQYEYHIDAFRSKQTRAWDSLINTITPKIYWKGDECNPFISIADLIAFLTDAKLYNQYLKLEPSDLQKAWKGYSFNFKVNFYDEKSLNYYSWINDEIIDITSYLAKPTIFLAIDEIEKPIYDGNETPTEDIGVENKERVRKFHQVIKRTDVYYSALKYAVKYGGSLKIFKQDEDMKAIKDGDVFVYVGSKSQKTGETFKHAFEIEMLSGLELRRKAKNNTL